MWIWLLSFALIVIVIKMKSVQLFVAIIGLSVSFDINDIIDIIDFHMDPEVFKSIIATVKYMICPQKTLFDNAGPQNNLTAD